MRKLATLIATCALAVAGCDTDSEQSSAGPGGTAQSPKSNTRGGRVTVGDETWTIVPKLCQIHNNDLVNISGHATEDPSLEISIDYGGPNQVVVGSGRDVLWNAMKETIEIQVEGRRVRGTANFNAGHSASGESAAGSFDVTC